MKILIADDEESIRNTLAHILESSGYKAIDFAEDGEEAIQKVKEFEYGILLLDIDMPKMDGYEVLKQVRSLYPKMPVIFMTGKGDSQKVMRSISQDKLDAYIEKPFNRSQILAVIDKIVSRK